MRDELALARRISDRLYENDKAAQGLGIELDEVRPGFARLTMTVRPDMLNTYGVCHGGFIFLLADSASGYASNSRNQKSMASAVQIEFLASARLGDALYAEAEERILSGSRMFYNLAVFIQNNEVLAMGQGRLIQLGGDSVPEVEMV